MTSATAVPAAPPLDIVAYRIPGLPAMELVPAPASRDWMDGTPEGRVAQLCLPMRMGNAVGWQLINPTGFRARWDGGSSVKAVQGQPLGEGRLAGFSTFGRGHVGFICPYIIRTPPGWNLWIKGPSNLHKPGASPVEALIEADWMTSSFHIAWRLTRRDHWVQFPAGEPIAQIVPVRRGDTEQFNPTIRNLDDNAEIAAGYRRWAADRAALIAGLNGRTPAPGETSREYFRTARQTKLTVCPFGGGA